MVCDITVYMFFLAVKTSFIVRVLRDVDPLETIFGIIRHFIICYPVVGIFYRSLLFVPVSRGIDSSMLSGVLAYISS